MADVSVMLPEWLAHENAVFDVAWVPGEPQLVGARLRPNKVLLSLETSLFLFTICSRPPQVTAAGDQMAKLWDVKTGELLGSFKGHLCSLKSVAFAPGEKGKLCLE